MVSTFFLVCFFGYSLCQNWPVVTEYTITDSNPFLGSFRVNLQQQAEIIISHRQDIGICFQRLYQVPAVGYYNNCSIFIPLLSSPVPNPSPVPGQVPLPPAPAPAQVPSPAPSLVPAPTPTQGPSPAPTQGPSPVPAQVPSPAPSLVPAPEHTPDPVPSTVPVPVSVPVPDPAPVPTPVPVPVPGSSPSPVVPKPNQTKRSIVSLQSVLQYMKNTNLGNSPYLVDFPDEQINFGIYYLDTAGPHEPENIHINFSGPSCNSTQIWDDTKCDEPWYILKNNMTYNIPISYLSSVFFSFEVPARSRQLTFQATNSGSQIANVYLRYQGTPSNISYDASGQSIVTFDLPWKGTWYARVVYEYQIGQDAGTEVPDPEIFYVTALFKPCEGGGVGLECNTTIDADPTKLVLGDLKASQWVYYKFIPTTNQPLWVSVQPQSGNPIPQVYASADQAPSYQHSDIKGCNQPNCEATTIIIINSTLTTNITWYIGLVSPTDTSYGIWFSSVCAPSCKVNGKCTTSGPSTGRCTCGDPFIGIDCSIESYNGLLPPQYIVLIVIASLVLSSVFIGFLAWLYMQKKYQGYSQK